MKLSDVLKAVAFVDLRNDAAEAILHLTSDDTSVEALVKEYIPIGPADDEDARDMHAIAMRAARKSLADAEAALVALGIEIDIPPIDPETIATEEEETDDTSSGGTKSTPPVH